MTGPGAQALQLWLRRTAVGLVGACGAYQIALGAYFMVFRPPLLPEDLRFLGTTAAQIATELPRLEQWLKLVFVVLGGQMAALGVLLGGFAAQISGGAMRRRETILLALTGILSATLMSGVNFALGSNFRWLLALPVLAWLLAIASAFPGARAARAGELWHER